MKNNTLIILLLIGLSFCTSVSAQTNYSTQTNEGLQKLKAEAVKVSDFAKAAEIKSEIDLRDTEQKKINDLQLDLDKKVKAEDFAGAALVQEQLKLLKDNKIKKEELRKKITIAVATSDFENAAKYKAELEALIAAKYVTQPDTKLNTKKEDQSNTTTKIFEGKTTGTISFDNVPADKITTYPEMQFVAYSKKNMARFEMSFNIPSYAIQTIIISNFDKGEYLSVTRLKSLVKGVKDLDDVVALFKLEPDGDAKDYSIKYLDEYKTILGYNCQKVIYKFYSPGMKKDIEMTGYMNNEYSSNDMSTLPRKHTTSFWFLDCSYPTVENMICNTKTITASQEPVSDDLFNTNPSLAAGGGAGAAGGRDKSAPIIYDKMVSSPVISQNELPIGKIRYDYNEQNSGKTACNVYNMKNVLVGRIITTEENYMVTIKVDATDPSGNSISSKKYSESMGSKEGVPIGLRWLVDNNYL